MLRAAVRLAERGFHIFPVHSVRAGGVCSCGAPHCARIGKHPRTMHGLKDASVDTKQIQAWWLEWPDANIGLVPWKSGHIVLDIDPRNNGNAGVDELEAKYGPLPDTAQVWTGGGGRHIYFSVPTGVDRVPSRLLRPGVELKAIGTYILAPPSVHLSVFLGAAPAAAGPGYAWDSAMGDHIVDAPFWLVEAPPAGKVYPKAGRPPIEGVLGAAFVHAGMAGRMLGTDKMAVECPWSSEHSQGDKFDSSTVVFGPSPGSNLGWFHCSHSHCSTRTPRDVLALLPKQSVEHAKEVVPKAAKELSSIGADEWERLLARQNSGAPSKDPGNLVLLMENLEDWKGIVALDESKNRIIWRRDIPGNTREPRAGRELRDGDYLDVAHWFKLNRQVSFGKEAILDVLNHVAQRARFNSLTESLNAFSPSQGLLETWLVKFCGAEDSEYTRNVGKWWLISAMARAYDPGVQADHVLVLEGNQGVGKTSIFRLLGGNWYDGSIPRFESTDALLSFQGVWIRELSELAGVSRADFATIKALITEKTDRFRPPYGRSYIDAPRRCVFCASVNPGEDYVRDPTGARRFWPVKVGEINLVEFSKNRDALLGEARQAYHDGELWYPPRAESELSESIRDMQGARQVNDPWSGPVLSLADTGEHTMEDFFGVLQMPVERRGLGEAKRIGIILRAHGFERKKRRNKLVSGADDPTPAQQWVWARP